MTQENNNQTKPNNNQPPPASAGADLVSPVNTNIPTAPETAQIKPTPPQNQPTVPEVEQPKTPTAPKETEPPEPEVIPEAPLQKQMTSNSTLVSFNYEEAPITDIVNAILLDAIKKDASDIHFDPYEQGLKIRIRIDGVLFDYSLVPLYVLKNMITRIKIIAGMNITETRVPQDGAIKNNLDNVNIDLRVSALPTNLGERVVIRILDYSMSSAGINELAFSKANLDKVNKMIAQPNGIILVTGATGSGKSTTVYAILQKLNTPDRNIITVEDPVEMNIEGVNQVQVIADIGLTFANVLRSVLRQDPDTIMIGEIRDDETARIAVRASITGHLVVSTIHTNNSLNTIERLLDMEVERYLLGAALTGVISQKLARKLCKECRTPRATNEYEKSIFRKNLNLEVPQIFTVKGCDKCHAGYSGRLAIHEVLMLNQDVRDAIVKNIDRAELRKLVYSSGTTTMLQDGLIKVIDGSTTIEEVLKMIEAEDETTPINTPSNTNVEQVKPAVVTQ